MIKRLFPWRYFLHLAARRYDFIDPITLLAKLRSFAQPSEVQEPIELLRAGMMFHARGLLNTKAIQHNLDWVWPYWIERQFNPADSSFIPRAFSFSHINLTHRNWTAIGRPDMAVYPIVDPHGLITPLHDGWSLDCWYYGRNGETLFPSRLEHVKQSLIDDETRKVLTECQSGGCRLRTLISMDEKMDSPVVKIEARVEANDDGWLIFALRPFNPEGIQFIESAETLENSSGWLVNEKTRVLFGAPADKIIYSNYQHADVSSRLHEPQTATAAKCRIGMVTAAAFFAVGGDEKTREVKMMVPLNKPAAGGAHRPPTWHAAVKPAATLEVPDPKIKSLYDIAVRTLIHLAADDIVPGPYTYKRFWFRDACLMLHPLLAIGLHKICRRQLDQFADLQGTDGFFHSQAGEWDSNGQVLWIYNRYRLLTGGEYNPDWLKSIERGGKWIAKKRIFDGAKQKYHGLLPPGFSAEHFGPNDYYYWDDFWAVAGLKAGADMLHQCGSPEEADSMRGVAREMQKDLQNSIDLVMREKHLPSIPSSPNRRMDSAAIGSLVADYPLQLLAAGDERMLATADYLMDNCLYKACFFQDMIHSGINIYMTLMLAQVYLRAGDPRYYALLSGAAALASPTGQWPEAIHPRTGGGCMGDGQHGWAAAEWVMMLRNMFVFEEGNRLIIGKGIRREWLQQGEEISFGPTLTPFGRVTVRVHTEHDVEVELEVHWHEGIPQPEIVVEVPGFRQGVLAAPEYRHRLELA